MIPGHKNFLRTRRIFYCRKTFYVDQKFWKNGIFHKFHENFKNSRDVSEVYRDVIRSILQAFMYPEICKIIKKYNKCVGKHPNTFQNHYGTLEWLTKRKP